MRDIPDHSTIREFLLADHPELSRPSRFAINLFRLLYFTFSEFRRDGAMRRALELAYTTLFTLVPITALFLIVSRVVGSLERWIEDGRRFIIGLTIGVLPESDAQAIDQFIDRAFRGIMASLEGSNLLVSITSLAILALFSISLLLSIENVFNDIFGVRRRRSLFAKVTVFWLVLTVAPLFLAASMYMRSEIVAGLEAHELMGFSLTQWALTFLFPFAVSTAAFFILYWKMPFTRVRIGPAVGAAITASALWEVAKSVLAWYVANNVTYKNIYGTLGTIPVFLLFLYVTWIITIFGAELAYAGHHFNQVRRREILRHLGRPESPAYLAVKLATMLATRFVRGDGAATADEMAGELELDVAQVEGMLEHLERAELVVAVADPQGAFQLARAPRTITVETVLAAVGMLPDVPAEEGRVTEVLRAMRQASVESVRTVAIDALVGEPAEVLPLTAPSDA